MKILINLFATVLFCCVLDSCVACVSPTPVVANTLHLGGKAVKYNDNAWCVSFRYYDGSTDDVYGNHDQVDEVPVFDRKNSKAFMQSVWSVRAFFAHLEVIVSKCLCADVRLVNVNGFRVSRKFDVDRAMDQVIKSHVWGEFDRIMKNPSMFTEHDVYRLVVHATRGFLNDKYALVAWTRLY